MTSLTRKFISTITSAYRNINSSTLNGAIDIIVVKQEDGTLRCTPFHVRFGKLGVLQSQNNKVYITINDVPVEDLYMQLGEAGEAVFVEEDVNTPVLQPMRHLEPSDHNTFFDPDNAISLSPDINAHLSNIDCSPQVVNRRLDEEKSHETHSSVPAYAYDLNSKATVDIDVLHSSVQGTNRRRNRRRFLNRADDHRKPTSEDDEHDLAEEQSSSSSSFKRRSRARKRGSTPLTSSSNRSSVGYGSRREYLPATVKLLRKRSASENDLTLFEFASDLTQYIDAHSRFHSIDSRQKTLSLHSFDTSQAHEHLAIRALSNPIAIEQTYDLVQAVGESEAILSKSAPTCHAAVTALRMSQSDDSAAECYAHEDYSPTSSYESAMSPRPTSPKSDTEYELDKSAQGPTSVGWHWKWGQFPKQRQSVLRYLWPSSKKSTPPEGMYLEEITKDHNIDRSLYLAPLHFDQHQQRPANDDDQESGTGNSIPQSPFREHEASCLMGDAQLSLCGHTHKQSGIPDEVFNAHLVSFETFASNPSIVNDPNLVVRIGGKYYNWSVALVMITSSSIFHKTLPAEAIEQLQEKYMAQAKPRTTASGGWWTSFYGKKSDMKNDALKTTTPTEPLVTAAKSEPGQTSLSRNNSMDHDKHPTLSKSDNEQVDSEVRTITAKIEQQQQQLNLSTPHSSHPTVTLKKTMILSSDELKRLNLKLGMNKVEFSVTTAWQGTTTIESNIFFFDHMTKFVISDIDGTITKSDVLGHIIPLVGGDWSHDGIAEFYNAIQENGYQFIYLSARAIGQSQLTRNFLSNIKQSDRKLPPGPLLISPDTLMTALYREVIAKKPEDFKIECLKNIASLFPGKNPFYAGFGNRINDQWSYTAVKIPVSRIYTINPQGEVVRQKLSQALSTSYKNLHEIVDLLFPPMDSFSASENYSFYTYWREEPVMDSVEDEMRKHLDDLAKRQKSSKSNGKQKSVAAVPSLAASTPTTGTLPKTTPTTTVLKPGGEKLLTIAQATENTVKRA